MNSVIQYFKDLFACCQDRNDVYVEIRFLNGNTKTQIPPAPAKHKVIKGIRFLFPREEFLAKLPEIIAWVKQVNEAGYNAFYGVLLRDENGNPVKDRIVVLYQDVDFKDGDYKGTREILKRLDDIEKNFGISIGGENSNCWVIASGRGQHYIFVLDKEISEEDFARYNNILYRILRLYEFPVDEKVAKDYARILRFPGTINWKYEDKPIASILTKQAFPLDLKKLDIAEKKLEEEEEEEEREIRRIIKLSEQDIEGGARELDTQKRAKIAELFLPYWVEGHRHNLLLGLLGYFLKAGVKYEDARDIVERICQLAGDEEKDHRLYLVDYHYNKRVKEKRKEELIGLTQIRTELAKLGIREEKINYVILKLQELVNRYELYNIFARTKYSHPRGGVANIVSMRGIFTWKEIFNKETGEYETVLDRQVIGAALVRVRIIRNPYTQIKEIEAEFITEANKRLKIRGTIHEIFARLYLENLIYSKTKAEEALQKLLVVVEKKGLAKVVEDVEVHGFYINSAGLLEFKHEFPRYDKEKVKEALEILNEFIERFCKQYPAKASEVIKNIITAPFNFVRKQMGLESWKWLILIGYGGTGKTTLSSLAGYIWDLPRTFEISAGSLSTEARVGRTLSRWTFPFVVNEVQELFYKDSKIAIRDLLKNAWSSIIVRGKYKAGEWVEELALASLLMTSNQDVDLTTAEQRRYKKIEFFSSEKPSPKQKQEFNEWKKNLEKLAHLGFPIYAHVRDNLSLLRLDDFRDAGERILEHLYKENLGYVPDWVYLRVEEEEPEERIREALKEEIETVIVEYINDRARRFLRDDPLLGDIHPVLARLKELNASGYEHNILYDQKERKVYIRRGFLKVLKEHGIEIATLDDLAALFGGEKARVKRKDLGLEGHNVAVIPESALFTPPLSKEAREGIALIALENKTSEEEVRETVDRAQEGDSEAIDKLIYLAAPLILKNPDTLEPLAQKLKAGEMGAIEFVEELARALKPMKANAEEDDNDVKL